MYRVVIADDEGWIVKGLLKAIHWEEEGFRVLYAGTSARDALQTVLTQAPELVITDIKMPEITGLELMRRAREAGLDCECIMLTGFAEFEFSQQAIAYGVRAYLLKPYTPEKLLEAVVAAREKIREKKLYQNYKIVKSLADSDGAAAAALERKGLLQRRRFIQAVTCIASQQQPLCGVNPEDIFSVHLTAASVTYFVGVDHDLFYADNIGTQSGVCWGISELCDGLAGLKLLADHSFCAAWDARMRDERAVRYQPLALKEANDLADRLVYNLEKGTGSAYLEGELSQALTQTPSLELFTYLQQRVCLYVYTKGRSLSSSGYELMDFYDFAACFLSISDFLDYLEELCALPQAESMQIPSCENNSFALLLQDVQKNYCTHLNLKELCAKHYINMNYCCALFRRNLGVTFSDYVQDLRLRHASKLISTTSLQIREIAELSGYNDYYYFQRVFKKRFDITPFQYRKAGGIQE